MTTVDQNFRIHEEKMISGQLFGDDRAGEGTMKGREEPITLQGKYIIKWDIYSQLDDSIRSEFLYLMLPVHNIQSSRNGSRVSVTISDTLPIINVHSDHPNEKYCFTKCFTYRNTGKFFKPGMGIGTPQ